MKMKIFLLISLVSFFYYQCVDEDQLLFEPKNSTVLQQKESQIKQDKTRRDVPGEIERKRKKQNKIISM